MRIESGSHPALGGELNCAMEWVAIADLLRQGVPVEEALWVRTASPGCTSRLVTVVVQSVNDRLDDVERQRLAPLVGRLGSHPETSDRTSRRLALWCARSVAHLTDDPEMTRAALDVLDGDVGGGELRSAWSQLATARAAAAYTAYIAAYADMDLVDWLSDLLDAHTKILADEGELLDVDDFDPVEVLTDAGLLDEGV